MPTLNRSIAVYLVFLSSTCAALPTPDEIPEYKKWAYINGLLPGRNRWTIDPAMGNYVSIGAILGAASSVIVAAVLVALHENGLLDTYRVDDIISQCSDDQQYTYKIGGVFAASCTSLGAALGGLVWLIAKAYYAWRINHFVRLEANRSADYILATPTQLLPSELSAIISEYKKDLDKLRLVHRVQMAMAWYKEVSLASIIAWSGHSPAPTTLSGLIAQQTRPPQKSNGPDEGN